MNSCMGDCERMLSQTFLMRPVKEFPAGSRCISFHFSPNSEISKTNVQGVHPHIMVRKLYHKGL